MKKLLFLLVICFSLPCLSDMAEAVTFIKLWGPRGEGPFPTPRASIQNAGDPGAPHDSKDSYPYVFYLIGGEEYIKENIFIADMLRPKYPEGITIPIYLGYLILHNDFRVEYVSASKEFVIPSMIKRRLDEYNNLPPDAIYTTTIRNEYFVEWSHTVDPRNAWLPRWSWNAALCIVDEIIWLNHIDAVYWSQDKPDENFAPRFKQTRLLSWEELGFKICLEELPETRSLEIFHGPWGKICNQYLPGERGLFLH